MWVIHNTLNCPSQFCLSCLVISIFTFHSHIPLPFPSSLTALHSVVNHCGWHSPISHSWTAEGLSRWAHSLAGMTEKSFPIFWTQMMSRRWVPLPHGTLHWNNKESYTSGISLLSYWMLSSPSKWMPYHINISKQKTGMTETKRNDYVTKNKIKKQIKWLYF